MKLLLIVLIIIITYSNCWSNDSTNNLRLASNNFSEKCITCSVYYAIVAEGLRRSNKFKIAEQSEKIREMLSMVAYEASKTGRSEEMATKVTAARFNMTTEEMLKDIDNNIENISVLIDEYGQKCKELAENPEKIFKETILNTIQ